MNFARAASACCVCVVGMCSWAKADNAAALSPLRNSPIVQAVRGARPSVVNIHSERRAIYEAATTLEPFEESKRISGMGTGVIIDERGYIITNDHVINGVQSIRIILCSGDSYAGRVVSRDAQQDLAILKIEARRPLPALPMGTSTDLMLGETVIAVGNAFGYENSVTCGIVSALGRSVKVNDTQSYDELIQTDASINPGNSGGPLLNMDGQWVGMNVAIRAGAQGIGFAIPIDKVQRQLAKLLSARKVSGTWHGIRCRLGAGTDGAGAAAGEVVAEEPEAKSPASKAGVLAGDRIVEAVGQPLRSALDLERALLDKPVGEKVTIHVERGGKRVELTLELERAPGEQPDARQLAWEKLGLRVEPASASAVRRPYRGGLLVTGVRPESPAAKQGIRRNDVLVGLHVWEVVSLQNLNYVLTNAEIERYDQIKFYILRGREEMFGHLRVARGGP